jgi:hypothetical protein
MADSIGVLEISGDNIPVLSSSLEASGNLNLRDKRSRTLYEQLIQGVAYRGQVGEAPKIGYTSLDEIISIVSSSDTAETNKFLRILGTSQAGGSTFVTGTYFQVVSSVFRYGEQTATPPSWTQRNIGLGHEFVTPVLSSSHHEVSRLNAFLSGYLPLEDSPVPASGATYYSKSQRLVHRVYKLSASVDLPVTPADIEQFPFDQEIILPRAVFDSVSGSYRAYSYFNPAVFEIDVTDYGRIRDIRVWVEFIHDVRGGTGSIGTSPAYTKQGLQNVQVALRSPNVSFRSAHPFWNDPQTFASKFRPFSNLTGSANQFGDQRYHVIPELLRGSYLLWAGHKLDGDDLEDTHAYYDSSYVSWNTDIDMRTVFWDASSQFNLRHLDSLFPNSTDISPGNPGPSGSAVLVLSGVLSGGAPNNKAFSIAATSLFADNPSARGQSVPWMIDSRIQTGSDVAGKKSGLRSGEVLTNVLGLSPPVGWLTGPSGTAGVGEFLTSGSNLGPDTIRPVYPLIDDVFVEKKYDETPDSGNESSVIPRTHGRMVGFRPGLRGTEIHGKWQLLIGMGAEFDPVIGMNAHPRSGIWFRQFRLEFIVDVGPEPVSFYPSKQQRFLKSSYVPRRPGKRRIQIISGSSSWDIGVNYVQTEVKQEYGRTAGITDLTGSSLDSFAVFSRLTGTLSDVLTGSQFAHTRYVYLNNEFGTPFIPISSGSGFAPSFDTFTVEEAVAAREIINEVLVPKPIIKQANTTKAHVARAKVVKSTKANVDAKIKSRFGPFKY